MSTASRMTGGAGNLASAPAKVLSGYLSPDMQKNSNSMASQAGASYGKQQAQANKLSGKTEGNGS